MITSVDENQWIFDAMKKMTENKEVSQKKATNYLDALLRVSAADSETGDKLSRRETVRMAAGFMYVNNFDILLTL